jgi:hypothetical protein
MTSPKRTVIRLLSAMTGVAVILLGCWIAHLRLHYESSIELLHDSFPFWKGAIVWILTDLYVAVPLYVDYRFMRFALRGN